MIRTIDGLRARLAEVRSAARAAAGADRSSEPTVALVSTIGALHDGHIDLISTARERADIVVVTAFVNPLRFATTAEYEAYPRTPEADEALALSLGADLFFLPEPSEMLPRGADTTRISAGDLGLRYEGRSRPRYFEGVLTVEAKLFQIVRPDLAVYGLRDRQRVFLVERMIRDLHLGVEVVAVETVRAADGLPVSTRVGLLEDRDLAAAAKLPGALEAAASNADRGVDACIAAAQSALMGEPRIRLEYLNVVDPATLLPVEEDHRGPALALIAATVAGGRFIDNAEICIG